MIKNFNANFSSLIFDIKYSCTLDLPTILILRNGETTLTVCILLCVCVSAYVSVCEMGGNTRQWFRDLARLELGYRNRPANHSQLGLGQDQNQQTTSCYHCCLGNRKWGVGSTESWNNNAATSSQDTHIFQVLKLSLPFMLLNIYFTRSLKKHLSQSYTCQQEYLSGGWLKIPYISVFILSGHLQTSFTQGLRIL